MSHMMQELLAIKRFREGQAEMSMRQQRSRMQEREAALQQVQEELARMLEAALHSEKALYADLCSRLVKLRDLEDASHFIAALKQQELLQRDAVSEAETLLAQAQQALTQARVAHQEAVQQTSKFLELAQRFDLLAAQEAERKEDLEMEEAASIARDKEDWHHEDELQ